MKKLLFAWMGFSVLLFGACADERALGGRDDDPSPVPTDILSLRLNMDGMEGKTRAEVLPELHEDEIESLYLLFFESKTDNSGKFIDYLEIETPLGIGEDHKIDMSGTQLKVTDPYHILAIANVRGSFGEHYLNGMDAAAWMLQWVGKTESEVIAQANAWTRTGMAVEPNQLLMSGRAEKGETDYDVDLTLVRNQVRFDIINSLKDDYEVVSVEIRNAYAGSKIWNDGSSRGALDFSDNTSRIPIYYKFDNNAANNPGFVLNGGDIFGGLYAFENLVAMPSRNDEYTTCLIVELKKKTPGSTSAFYRVNIAPDASPQMLQRNNAYRVTINNVGGPGETGPTGADKAYNNPNDNGLDYTINLWDQTGSGVMVTDGSSMLSVPYKTVTMARATITPGPPIVENSVSTSFQIFTFTNNPNPVSPLEIISQTYSLNNSEEEHFPRVYASLNGNVLTITAAAIPSGSTVKGQIKLGYAGLRATINVLQTDQDVDFLQVHLPDGGIPNFAPFGDIFSGLLRVEATGTWTAKILSEEGGFSFEQGNGTTVMSNDPESDYYKPGMISGDNKFRVWTFSANTLQSPRRAFLVVSLDKDSENYAQVVELTQNATAEIAIIPQHTVTFDGTGELALIPNNTDDQFVVRPSQTSAQPPLFEPWEAVITGANANMFELDGGNHTTSTADPDANFVRVKAVGKNTSGGSYKATLTVRLTARHAVATSIDLVQTSSGIALSPNSVPAVAKTGGETELIAVQADTSLQWQLLGFTVSDGSPTKDPVNHTVALVNQNNVPITSGTPYSVANDKFKVVFPKIYYPNRDIPISATVEIGIVGSSLTKSITVNQTPLTASAFNVAAPQPGGYGNLHGGSYNLYFRTKLKAMGPVSLSISAGSNMLYRNYEGLYQDYPWSVENNFRGTRDALTMIVSDEYAPVFVNALNNGDSPLTAAEFSIAHAGSFMNATINTAANGTKVYQLLVGGAAAGVPAVDTSIDLYEDGVSTQVVSFPATTVPIIVSGGNTGRAFLAIDPQQRLIYLGESQMFDTVAGNPFLDNLMVYIKNAAIYGSHFTDLMIDGNGQLPAPWDNAWGANKGVAK